MKLFKNPVFALFLAVVIVIGSTLLSTHIKLGRKADAVSDLLFEGVEDADNGYTRPAIAKHLENLCGCADGLVTLARNYEIDTQDVEDASTWLKNALRYSKHDASLIHWNYAELIKSVNELSDQLSRVDLSQRDSKGLTEYMNTIAGIQSSIGEAGYNEAVRTFRRKYDRFPTNALAVLSGVDFPEYFE